MNGIVSYGTYLPAYRLNKSRVVACFDEDSTTMGVAAASATLAKTGITPDGVYFASTTPAYADKANSTAVHAALGLPSRGFACDVNGSARSAVAAFRSAHAGGGLAVVSDVRLGRPGSADERMGTDGAAAFLFGSAADVIAEVIGYASVTSEFLDRWRAPGAPVGMQWEERFGFEQYRALIDAARADIGIETADHVVVVSPNSAIRKWAAKTFAASPLGHAGTADLGLALAAVLDTAGPGESVLLISAADGCDAIALRTTEHLVRRRQSRSVAAQLDSGMDIDYVSYLTWRGLLDRESARRPEPERVAAPPSARERSWKFSFTGSRCRHCELVHLPPARVCKRCHTVDDMVAAPTATSLGTVATFTVDRLAHSPAPPLVEAVVDFDGGGRYTLEVTDGAVDRIGVGSRVMPTFRRVHSAGGVHNYFWKVRIA